MARSQKSTRSGEISRQWCREEAVLIPGINPLERLSLLRDSLGEGKCPTKVSCVIQLDAKEPSNRRQRILLTVRISMPLAQNDRLS